MTIPNARASDPRMKLAGQALRQKLKGEPPVNNTKPVGLPAKPNLLSRPELVRIGNASILSFVISAADKDHQWTYEISSDKDHIDVVLKTVETGGSIGSRYASKHEDMWVITFTIPESLIIQWNLVQWRLMAPIVMYHDSKMIRFRITRKDMHPPIGRTKSKLETSQPEPENEPDLKDLVRWINSQKQADTCLNLEITNDGLLRVTKVYC